MLLTFEHKLIELEILEDPISEAGEVFVNRDGKLLLTRLMPKVWKGDSWEPAGFLPPVTIMGRHVAAGDIAASGLFYPTWSEILDTTQLAINLDLDTHKVAIFGSATTPDFGTDTKYGVAPYNADEKDGGSWPSGGYTLIGTAVTESPAGSLKWDATDVTQATSTFTGGEGCLTYASALADEAICLHDFGTTASPNAGTMEIQWAGGGLVAIDLTP